MPAAYFHRSLKIFREMDILAVHLLDSLLRDCGKGPRCCSLIQISGRFLHSQLYINLEKPPLIGLDLCMACIEGISLFIVFPDNTFQRFRVDPPPSAAHPFQKFLHLRPAMFVQSDSRRIGIVSQNQAKKFPQFDITVVLYALILHIDSPP